MFKRIMTAASMVTVLATGSILAGQNTGGDKGRRTRTRTTRGLTPPNHYRLGFVATAGVIAGIEDIQTR